MTTCSEKARLGRAAAGCFQPSHAGDSLSVRARLLEAQHYQPEQERVWNGTLAEIDFRSYLTPLASRARLTWLDRPAKRVPVYSGRSAARGILHPFCVFTSSTRWTIGIWFRGGSSRSTIQKPFSSATAQATVANSRRGRAA
jgi:hypothetical protein